MSFKSQISFKNLFLSLPLKVAPKKIWRPLLDPPDCIIFSAKLILEPSTKRYPTHPSWTCLNCHPFQEKYKCIFQRYSKHTHKQIFSGRLTIGIELFQLSEKQPVILSQYKVDNIIHVARKLYYSICSRNLKFLSINFTSIKVNHYI